MGNAFVLKDLFTLASITVLIVTGVVISLQSGTVAVVDGRSRHFLGNFSSMIFGVAGCLAFLLFIHQVIGLRVGVFGF